MRGIKKLTVFSRRVISKAASKLDLSAPTLTSTARSQQYGDDGHGGKQGVPGPEGRTNGVSDLVLKMNPAKSWAINEFKRTMSSLLFSFIILVDIYADTLGGYLNILVNGGNGNQGQNGREGRAGVKRGYKVQA